jgi:hypothetical protein
MQFQTRRAFLSTLTGISAFPGLALAHPDDDEGGSGRDVYGLNGIPGTRTADGKNRVTQRELGKLSYDQFRWLELLYEKDKLIVPGFSKPMLDWLFRGSIFRHRSMVRLIRRLRGVTDMAERSRILNAELGRLNRQSAVMRETIDGLYAKQEAGQELTDRESNLLGNALKESNSLGYYSETVKVWAQYPQEGLLSE